MPTWAWVLTCCGCAVVGAAGGFTFAGWLIAMNRRDQRNKRLHTYYAEVRQREQGVETKQDGQP
jgi:hypothetical protein